ncbi:MAG: PAS domain-containing protein, partial [Spirochaetales bacterium]|nr:PAS domain-containing protein [Spirochaetales bacterium]
MSEKPGAEDLKNVMRELEALNPDLGEVRRSLETEFNYHRLLFDVTRDGVLVYNLSDGTIRDINQTMLYMFGYEEDEILSRGLDFPDIKELKNLCEKACTMEKQLHRKDGSLIWTEITAKHIEMEGESLLFVLISDIDSHKKIEEVLESRRNRLRYILEGTNLGTWEWNVQTGETIFNEYWANILGYTLDEISPTDVNTWKNLVYTEDLERSVNELMAYTRGESEFYDNEYRMVHKDGHLVWIQDRGKVISRTSDGQALWMYGSHQDISD